MHSTNFEGTFTNSLHENDKSPVIKSRKCTFTVIPAAIRVTDVSVYALCLPQQLLHVKLHWCTLSHTKELSGSGKNTSKYEGEICADQEVAKQLMALYLPPGRVVYCFYSQAVISALSSNRLPATSPVPLKAGGIAHHSLDSKDWTRLDMYRLNHRLD
ncbi:hypothetical protein CDAR_5511 [Caerostris darwini]|uniref:Uncharacterized protein n=1 Tax=Caerostris darwini TaxID=1538125 RepID=A0AAV4PKR3_9ARAC|nr:hypothetical protein CDAR_5511 [Caerostris darwini]